MRFPSPSSRLLLSSKGEADGQRRCTYSSKVKLAYSDAQEVIDGKGLPEGKVDDADLRSGVESDVLALAVRLLPLFPFVPSRRAILTRH